jgi:hypothetical protein
MEFDASTLSFDFPAIWLDSYGFPNVNHPWYDEFTAAVAVSFAENDELARFSFPTCLDFGSSLSEEELGLVVMDCSRVYTELNHRKIVEELDLDFGGEYLLLLIVFFFFDNTITDHRLRSKRRDGYRTERRW